MKFKPGDIIKDIETPSSEWLVKIQEIQDGEYSKVLVINHDIESEMGNIVSFQGYSYFIDESCEVDEDHIVTKILTKYGTF